MAKEYPRPMIALTGEPGAYAVYFISTSDRVHQMAHLSAEAYIRKANPEDTMKNLRFEVLKDEEDVDAFFDLSETLPGEVDWMWKGMTAIIEGKSPLNCQDLEKFVSALRDIDSDKLNLARRQLDEIGKRLRAEK